MVQEQSHDALSDILTAIQARAVCSISLVAGGDWAIQFPMPAQIKFNAVRRGACWLLVGGQEPALLSSGDCVVIAQSAFTLASGPSITPIPAREIFGENSMAAQIGEGDGFSILGGSVAVDKIDGLFLAQALPPTMVIRGGSAASISWLLSELDREWDSGAPGARLLCNDLLRIIFIQVLRSRIESGLLPASGWFAGLGDPRIARALHAIHADPARSWTVEALARLAGQSRSAFAAEFRRRLDQAPMDYLTSWRMRLAATHLRSTTLSIPQIASKLGYDSDSAFSARFRRVQGTSPAQYRRSHRL
ncbi:AraC family transcriptional regulator [Tianweitania sp. Rool2]|uniref:AraC family transcriptional regulator n=1 Tax=Oryzicola mucosus TaxID=2767425 RepID=A0A8J6PMX9_9HYPH|nr:AraC family transcriptional regulator [Oryzicola mucosus]